MTWLRRVGRVVAYADGAIGDGQGPSGVGAVLMDGRGRVLCLGNRRERRMTNNEAEYAGLILALELALQLRPQHLDVYLDSAVVVGQMKGECGVHAQALQPWHRKACQLARKLPQVSYAHVPRERNHLADALANEALQGQILRAP
ncbi:MAG: ribonuclease HI family protein [Anaerolineae bacterium]|nr:ribonuclease HI family protein [Anaerolineae bacterium]